jgi:hypothetical protein
MDAIADGFSQSITCFLNLDPICSLRSVARMWPVLLTTILRESITRIAGTWNKGSKAWARTGVAAHVEAH